MAHHCPKCELVFVNRNELDNHLAVDHYEGPPEGIEGPPGVGDREDGETGSGGVPEPSNEAEHVPPEERRGLFGWLRGARRRS
jgi:hypothetical protein